MQLGKLMTIAPEIYQRDIYNVHNSESEAFEAGKRVQLEHNRKAISIIQKVGFDEGMKKATDACNSTFDAQLVEARKAERERIVSIIKEYKLEGVSARDDSLERRAIGWRLLWKALKAADPKLGGE